MSIFRKTALHRTTDNQWLIMPPYSLKCTVTPIFDMDYTTTPLGTIICNYRKQTGWNIAVSGKYRGKSILNALAFKEALKSFINSADGITNFLTVTDFVDSGNTYQGFYRSCFCTKDPVFTTTGKGLRELSYSFELTSIDPLTYTSASDSTTPPASIYDQYFRDTTTGQSQGNGVGTGTTIIYSSTSYQQSFSFDNLIDAATDANNVSYRQIGWILSNNCPFTLETVQIVGCGNTTGSSGNTTLVFSDGDYTQYATANKVTLSVPYNQVSTVIQACSLTIPSGNKLYIYVYAAAGHQDMQFTLGVRR